MKKLIVLTFTLFSFAAFAQDNLACSDLDWDDASESIMQDGKPFTGSCENYYDSGSVKEVRSFENGKLTGPFKSYHEGGALASEGQYVNGVADGVWKHYSPTGTLISEKTYENGEVK